jgi:hypothetical protein
MEEEVERALRGGLWDRYRSGSMMAGRDQVRFFAQPWWVAQRSGPTQGRNSTLALP